MYVSLLSDFPYVLNYKCGLSAPKRMSRPVDAVVYNETAYFRRYRTRVIDMYNSQAQKWSTLPECPVQDASLAILPTSSVTVECTLHTVGGFNKDICRVCGDLFCLSMRFAADCFSTEYYWAESSFPAMKEPRRQITTAYDRGYNCLIAAGGQRANGPTNTVEVLNIKAKQWFTVASLPCEVFRASGCISRGYLYIAGGHIYDQVCNDIEVKSVVRVSLSVLIQSKRDTRERVYQYIADLPHERSACTSFHDRVFAIGGTRRCGREAMPTNQVYLYHSQEDVWEQVPNPLIVNRCCCFAVSFVFPKPQLMVVGGYTIRHDTGCTDSVEIAEVEF